MSGLVPPLSLFQSDEENSKVQPFITPVLRICCWCWNRKRQPVLLGSGCHCFHSCELLVRTVRFPLARMTSHTCFLVHPVATFASCTTTKLKQHQKRGVPSTSRLTVQQIGDTKYQKHVYCQAGSELTRSNDISGANVGVFSMSLFSSKEILLSNHSKHSVFLFCSGKKCFISTGLK